MADLAAVAKDMTAHAADLVTSLSDERRKKLCLDYADEKERRTWFYTPTPRSGVMLQELDAVQRQKVRRLLASGLTQAGYNYASVIMGLENIVDYWQGFPDRTWGTIPNTRVRDPHNYTVAVWGTPGAGPWAWRIGGHHLSLAFTLRDGAVSPTPAFFGAEPARAIMPGGVYLRPLAAEEDSARALFLMLRPDQRTKALISPIAPTDVVQTNRPRIEDGALPPVIEGGPGGSRLRKELGITPEHDEMVRYTTKPKGLPVSEMDFNQREAFSRVVRVYFDHLKEPIVEQYAAIWTPERLGSATFAWAGPTEPGAPHYYRIQAQRLLIEYDCTQNNANHTHSVVRDPENDFGDDLMAQHYAHAPAGHGHDHPRPH
jgi:hypothetical protein